MRALPGLALPMWSVLAITPVPPGNAVSEIRELVRDGRFARAEARAEAELRAVAPCSLERVELLALEAEAARRGNKKLAPETLAGASGAAELAAELFGGDDPRNAEPLLQLGALRCVRGEWAEAKVALERSLELMRASRGDRCPDPKEATALAYLAVRTYSEDNDGERALALLADADRVLDRATPGESPERAWIHDMRGNVYHGLDRPEDSLHEYRTSLEMRRGTQRGGHPLFANTLLNVGTMQDQLGRLAEARASYQEVVAFLENEAEIAWTLGDVRVKLGAVCLALEDHAGARASFERALAELEAKGQQGSAVYASVLENLGRLAYARRDFDAARSFAARSLAALDTLPGAAQEHRGSLEVFSGWIELQEKRPDRDRAEELADEAAAAGEPTASELQAWIAADRGDLERAHALLSKRATDIRERGGRDAPQLPKVLSALARVDFLRGEFRSALAESLEGEAVAREMWEASALGLEDLSAVGLESAVPFAQIVNPAVCAAARLRLPAENERVWDALLLSRDRVLRECEERLALARATGTPELARARDELARSRQALAGLYVQRSRSPTPTTLDEPIRAARATREARERDLSALVRIDRPASEARATVRDLCAKLEPGVGLVRMCLADRPPATNPEGAIRLSWEPCYFACALSRESQGPCILELGPKAEIDALVSELVGRIRAGAGNRDVRDVAAALRRRILDPVLAALPGVRLLHVVPESDLSRVPFVALCSDAGIFLAESGPTLFVLGSELDLLRAPSASGSGLLALGDPAFADGDGLSGGPALPETRGEIEAVVGSWRKSRFASEGVRVLLGADATEDAFRRSIRGRRVIHLATHGFFEDERGSEVDPGARGPSKSPSAPSAPPRPSAADRATALPFLRSGLVFRNGAGRGGEDDGILTTEEVLALDLGGVDWVVLSACNTGVGEIRVLEGVLGLQRAMRLAGARTAIASLWPVEDPWARAFMEALYRARFEEGRSTAEAMRRASLEVLERERRAGEEPEPRRWASFVAVGDWR